MNTDMHTAHALPVHTRFSALYSRLRSQWHAALQPPADTVRVALAYLGLWVFAILLAAACIAHWRVYFVF